MGDGILLRIPEMVAKPPVGGRCSATAGRSRRGVGLGTGANGCGSASCVTGSAAVPTVERHGLADFGVSATPRSFWPSEWTGLGDLLAWAGSGRSKGGIGSFVLSDDTVEHPSFERGPQFHIAQYLCLSADLHAEESVG